MEYFSYIKSLQLLWNRKFVGMGLKLKNDNLHHSLEQQVLITRNKDDQ